ncbi:MAG TPA: RluA family pseudouridine synthase [Polyangia bacterium]|nr:RluA family pseudouridine synthase [Polyangia bacterium]
MTIAPLIDGDLADDDLPDGDPPQVADDATPVAREIITLRIEVPRECDGWRLDHFLKRRIGRLSRTRIQGIIATQISLPDGRRVRASSPVHAGQVFVLRRPAPDEPPVPRHFSVLFEDADVLALDKPAGLPMHTTAKFWKNTLVALLRERYPDEKMEIAHRIDRETSGVLLVARHHQAASWLKMAFARRAVSKQYLALVKGQPPDDGVIDMPIRLLDSPTHLMMGPAADGLPAVTRFRVVQRFADHALCEARPETGRQHQIRVHLAAMGYPIVGDKLYGGGEPLFMRACDEGLTPELLAAFDNLARHALHAHRLTFPHPTTRQNMTVESPLPPDLVDYIAGLAPS